MIDAENNKDKKKYTEQFNSLSNPYNLMDTKPSNGIDTNICSQQCCKFTQWPVPFNTTNPNSIDLSNYIGSNFSCNNGQSGGGCVCISKDNYNYLSNHGQYQSTSGQYQSTSNQVPDGGPETKI